MIDMEKWKPVVGFEGLYEVSDIGNVRSVDRFTRDGRFWKGREISKTKVAAGYMRAVLSVDGKYNHVYVHRLVADAFVPNHIDGDKTNNSVSNLEWVTKRENGIHAYKVLGHVVSKNMLGKASPNRKFTDEQAEEIRASDKSCYAIAKEYGVSHSTIQDIRNGKTYRVRRTA